MIRYELVCRAEHRFEAWFRDSAAYDEQEAAGRLECPVCGETEIRKAPMAPAVARPRRAVSARGAPPSDVTRPAALLRALRALDAHVRRHFEDVGERFPEEARRIHEGEAEARGIYGVAAPEEVRELLDEGVPVLPLPRLPKLDA